MITVNIHEVKKHLSAFLKRIESGEEILIAKSGHPIARISPLLPASGRSNKTLNPILVDNRQQQIHQNEDATIKWLQAQMFPFGLAPEKIAIVEGKK